MSRILITGGTGCIGSNLARLLLADGHEVRILRRTNSDTRTVRDLAVEHVVGDLLDPSSLKKAMEDCETVYHAGAMVTFVRGRREEQLRVNVEGTRNVVEACRALRVRRLVHVSSVAAIGSPPPGELATEATTYNWGESGSYRYSKFLGEQEIARGVAEGLDAVIVNPTVVVGERDAKVHGGQIVLDIKRGRIPCWVAGGMNVVNAADVARGMILCAAKGRTGERYILGGENLTHKEIFRRTAALIGGRAPWLGIPVPVVHAGAAAIENFSRFLGVEPWVSKDLVAGAGSFNWFSLEKARKELGYTFTSFDETILAAYHWYQANGML